jgi:hypothetical protein
MIRTREKLRELCACAVCIAVATTELCACTQTVSVPRTHNTTIASPQQNTEMEEIVITASRRPEPTG